MSQIRDPWIVESVAEVVVARLAAAHVPNADAVSGRVDIFGGPQREDDDGRNWALLHEARRVEDVVPGSAVLLGSRIGTYLAKVVAWDFAVSDDDPTLILELLPVTPEAVERALARRQITAA